MFGISNSVSIKSFYRFVEFVSKLCGGGLPHERYKRIALDRIAAESKEEKEAKALADAFHYLLLNVSQPLSREILGNAYYLLSGSLLGEDISRRLLERHYMDLNDSPERRVRSIQREVLKQELPRKVEYAFLLSNLVFLQCGRRALVPYPSVFEVYWLNTRMDDMDRWLFLIAQMEEKHSDAPSSPLSLDAIIERIKPELHRIQMEFGVELLALYGSVAKGNANLSSDLDFLVKFDETLLDFERGRKSRDLKSFLNRVLGGEVDLIDFTHALKDLDIQEMQNAIVLIKSE